MTAPVARIQYSAEELEFQRQRTVKCKSCGAAIIWFKTLRGKSMPVNAETVFPFDTTLDLRSMKSHFSTCPNSDKHRKPR